jgi:uncharacterized protein
MPVVEERFTVALPADAVWAFLLDAERLGPCIPGCAGVEVVDERTFRLTLTVKVGFLSTVQDVRVRITDADPPRHLVSVGRGEDRKLGSQVDVRSTLDLVPLDPATTEVRYRSEMKVLGRLGSVGDAVMRARARQFAEEFAANVRAAIERRDAGAPARP